MVRPREYNSRTWVGHGNPKRKERKISVLDESNLLAVEHSRLQIEWHLQFTARTPSQLAMAICAQRQQLPQGWAELITNEKIMARISLVDVIQHAMALARLKMLSNPKTDENIDP
jgi:hypothetical protein